MKTAIFLRHSLAENKRYGERDFDRKLTLEGVELAKLMAKKLKNEVKLINLAVVSPANRTVETLNVFKTEIDVERIVYKNELYYDMGLGDFERIFFELEDNNNTVLIVGHNPFITQMSMYFTDKYDLFLHPASFVVVHININKWTLIDKIKVVDYKVYLSK
jgi:phosphohistidine phosphatase